MDPAVMAKILTQNGHVLHRSTYRLLTPNEIAGNNRSDAQEQLMARVYEKLGYQFLPREL